MSELDRTAILTEHELPDANDLIAKGRRLAESIALGSCPFLADYGVESEADYKRERMRQGALMFHAQTDPGVGSSGCEASGQLLRSLPESFVEARRVDVFECRAPCGHRDRVA